MESSLDEAPMTATALGRNRDSNMSSSFFAGFASKPVFYFQLNAEPRADVRRSGVFAAARRRQFFR
jgi:hypothetical protein